MGPAAAVVVLERKRHGETVDCGLARIEPWVAVNEEPLRPHQLRQRRIDSRLGDGRKLAAEADKAVVVGRRRKRDRHRRVRLDWSFRLGRFQK